MSDIAQDLGGVVLLPCPFCGGRGEVGGIPWVECQACEASGPQAETEEAAIAAWNTRAHSAEIAGALRDAERYRWLKDKANYARNSDPIVVFGPKHDKMLEGPLLDAAIDSAMQQGGGGGE